MPSHGLGSYLIQEPQRYGLVVLDRNLDGALGGIEKLGGPATGVPGVLNRRADGRLRGRVGVPKWSLAAQPSSGAPRSA